MFFQVFASFGLYDMFRHVGNWQQKPENIFFSRAVDIFHQESFSEIHKENSKLRTYKLFKDKIGREPYLDSIKNVQDRIAFTKLRLSNHNLMIEKGRHQNIPKNFRYCPFCPYIIEDELHCLLNCKSYVTHRRYLFETIRRENICDNFLAKNYEEKFKLLMGNPRLVGSTAKFVIKIFYKREFLIKRHKNNT